MLFRRISIPIALVLTFVLQFLPGASFAVQPAAAVSCDAARFVADVTVSDGSFLAPGATFVKTWRLRNAGSCTWTTSYSAIFVSGDQMGAPTSVNLPTSVAPGATVDISVNMTAPSTPAHYRGNWKLRNASSAVFGVGASGNAVYWVDINVSPSGSTGTSYDFVANFCSATWTSGAGGLTCPGTDGNVNGFMLNVAAPQLENGSTASSAGLVVNPQQVAGGYIKGYYPAYTVHTGDHFQGIVNCAYNASGCYVNFQLKYQINSGPINTFWSFNERYDGLYYPFNIDLSSLAGQNVNFILYVADVSGHGTPSGDRATWVGARIAGSGGVPLPPFPPSPACNKGAFVTDVTIPDGSVLAPGQSFTKTWEIKNVGSCTWTTSYALVHVFGDQLGAPNSVNLPSSVAPGTVADFSVNMVAPTAPGHYRSYWRFLNASSQQFGVGRGMVTFFADIVVSGSPTPPPSGPGLSTTSITSDAPDPSAPGQSVAVGVTVSGSGGTPTGTVAISGADSNCTITLSSGSGTCNVAFNITGHKILTAQYSGDSTYASSSDTEGHDVVTTLNLSTTTITQETPDPSIPGQVVNVTVSVTGSGTTPTGTVALSGADSNCTITLSGGSGTCGVIFNSVGSKTITASYSGNANYAGSVATATHNVGTGKANTATSITNTVPNPSTPGQAVVVSVTVSGAGLPTPTGTVSITGADTNCSILLAGGTGSCSVVFNTTGHKTLTATYSGDGNYDGSSGSFGQNVIQGSTTTSITSVTPEPSSPGAPVTVSFTVTGGGATPTGIVSITGADVNCSITLSGGSGSCSVVFNTIGLKTLTATYSGDANYLVSTTNKNHAVGNSTTTTIVSDNPDPSHPHDLVLVTVTVSGTGAIAPTGVVSITGADVNCTTPPLAPIGVGIASAQCNVRFNSAGAKVLTATYGGDAIYVGSSGTANHAVDQGTSTVVINHPPTPNNALVNQSVTVDVTVGGAGVTPTGTVAISISGIPSSCTITLSGGTGSCTVVFNTPGTWTITATYSGDGNYLGDTTTRPITIS